MKHQIIFNFELDKANGDYVGQSESTTPEDAALNILQFNIFPKQIHPGEIKVKQIDDKWFEVLFENEEYILIDIR